MRYILDEIDSALDLSHTQNIGHMIRTHFPHSQFIVTWLAFNRSLLCGQSSGTLLNTQRAPKIDWSRWYPSPEWYLRFWPTAMFYLSGLVFRWLFPSNAANPRWSPWRRGCSTTPTCSSARASSMAPPQWRGTPSETRTIECRCRRKRRRGKRRCKVPPSEQVTVSLADLRSLPATKKTIKRKEMRSLRDGVP